MPDMLDPRTNAEPYSKCGNDCRTCEGRAACQDVVADLLPPAAAGGREDRPVLPDLHCCR